MTGSFVFLVKILAYFWPSDNIMSYKNNFLLYMFVKWTNINFVFNFSNIVKRIVQKKVFITITHTSLKYKMKHHITIFSLIIKVRCGFRWILDCEWYKKDVYYITKTKRNIAWQSFRSYFQYIITYLFIKFV